AYVFVKPNGGWSNLTSETAKLIASDADVYDRFGVSVAISEDTIVVGASLDNDGGNDSGSAYVYVKPNDGWANVLSETAKLTASDTDIGDWFGSSVGISGDTVVVGAFLD